MLQNGCRSSAITFACQPSSHHSVPVQGGELSQEYHRQLDSDCGPDRQTEEGCWASGRFAHVSHGTETLQAWAPATPSEALIENMGNKGAQSQQLAGSHPPHPQGWARQLPGGCPQSPVSTAHGLNLG